MGSAGTREYRKLSWANKFGVLKYRNFDIILSQHLVHIALRLGTTIRHSLHTPRETIGSASTYTVSPCLACCSAVFLFQLPLQVVSRVCARGHIAH